MLPVRPRNKLVSVQLVQVDAELIQAAIDYLMMSGSTTITFQVINGRCVDIDTETPAKQVLLPSPPPPQIPSREADDGVLFESMDETAILNIMRRGVRSARDIGDNLGVDRNDTPIRSKVSRLLRKMREDGMIVAVKGKTGHYTIKGDKVATSDPAEVFDKKLITPEAVLHVISEIGPSPSMAISDKLEIPRKSVAARAKVSAVLGDLKKAEKVLQIGKVKGFYIYQLKAA